MNESGVPLKDQASIMDIADKIHYFCALILTTEYDGVLKKHLLQTLYFQ